ncbi:MAG: hypothetical protein ACK4IS_10740 [Erythrobacter sp.]
MKLRLGQIAAVMLAASALSGCAAALIPVLASGALATTADTGSNAGEARPEPAALPAPARPGSVTVNLPPKAYPPAAAAPAPAPLITTPLAALQLTSFDPGFARLADYALAEARRAASGTPPVSAVLADPVALDGARRICREDQTAVVVIDLDPAGGAFAAPASLPALPEHAAALAEMRAAGIAIAWISHSPVTQTGAIRRALEGAGLDPRGADMLVLAQDSASRKQVLRDTLASNSCILAIGGDERADFDERFGYLRNPAAGARLETLIGEGPWFLIRNIFSSTPSNEAPAP